jgi:hypothetical protein
MSICESLGICTVNQPHTLSYATGLTLELIVIGAFLAFVSYVIAVKHWKSLKNLLITTVGVILFELLIDPAVTNVGFSSWTYFFHDLTFILTMAWALIVSASITLVDFAFEHIPEIKRFLLYLCMIDVFALLTEIFFVTFGLRQYGPSIIASSLGYSIPFTPVPIGVIFAIPAVFALVLAFTKYWEKVFHSE